MKTVLLNSNLKYMLARMGHRDLLALTDAGFNIPKDVETVDLALKADLPTIEDTLDAILSEVSVEKIFLAEEIKTLAPQMLEMYRRKLPDAEFEFMPHTPQFDDLVGRCKGAVRSGQWGLHAPNAVLKIGCEY